MALSTASLRARSSGSASHAAQTAADIAPCISSSSTGRRQPVPRMASQGSGTDARRFTVTGAAGSKRLGTSRVSIRKSSACVRSSTSMATTADSGIGATQSSRPGSAATADAHVPSSWPDAPTGAVQSRSGSRARRTQYSSRATRSLAWRANPPCSSGRPCWCGMGRSQPLFAAMSSAISPTSRPSQPSGRGAVPWPAASCPSRAAAAPSAWSRGRAGLPERTRSWAAGRGIAGLLGQRWRCAIIGTAAATGPGPCRPGAESPDEGGRAPPDALRRRPGPGVR